MRISFGLDLAWIALALTGRPREVTDMAPEDIAAVTESDGYKHVGKYTKGEPSVGEVANPDGPGLHPRQAGAERFDGR